MDFSLTPEQRLIQQTATRLANEVLSPQAATIDAERVFPRSNLASLSEAGLMGILLPPPFGGAGADTLSFVIATEALARACASTAIVYVTHVSGSFGLLVASRDAAKRRMLPDLAKGSRLAAFAATEAASGSNPVAIQTTARREGNEYRMNGSKSFITAAGNADVYLTSAITDRAAGPEGLSLIAIEKGTPGLTFGKNDETMGLRGARRGELFFDDCAVPAENLLGNEGGGMMASMAIGGLGVLGAAAISLGLAEAALAASIQHGKERVIAGQPIGRFQAVQFMIAEMSVAADAARSLIYNAVCQRDNAPPGLPIPSFKAKLFASEVAIKVTDQALQVHGGHGYSRELPIERYYRDARGQSLHFSVTEPLKEMLGKMLMGMFPPIAGKQSARIDHKVSRALL